MALPYEMIDEILCRLPVKPLLRFRCVSKGWCSLIDSNAFAKKQLKKTLDCNAGLGLMMVIKRKGDRRFYLAGSDSLDDESVGVVEIDDPLKGVLYNAHIVGSSNGLMCVFKSVMDVFVLNPTTRKYRKIARVPPEFRSRAIMRKPLCGFGYDEVDDDFKVVMIAETDFFHGLITVYSLKTNTWAEVQEVQDVPDDIGFTCLTETRASYSDGYLYWMALKAMDHQLNFKVIIIGFDLKLRHFKEVPFPPIKGHASFSNRNLGDIGGCLCILDILDSHMDVWLMNYPGAESTWHKAFSVKKQELPVHTSFSKLVAFSRSGEDILLQVRGFHTQLAWYNIDRKTVKNIGIHGIPQYCSFPYTESLLQLTEDEALQQTIKRQAKEECIKMEKELDERDER